MGERINTIYKVKAKDFSIHKLYSMIIDELKIGEYAWEHYAVAADGTDVFKVPNYADGDYGYVGIKYDHVTPGYTYFNWLKNKDNFRKYILYNPDCANLSQNDLLEMGDSGNALVYKGEASIYDWLTMPYKSDADKIYVEEVPQIGWPRKAGKGGAEPDVYNIIEAEAFYKDSDVIFFTMFKQYEEGFTWNEFIGNQRKTTHARRIKYHTRSGQDLFWDKPPLYPGEGCPALGSASGFFKQKAHKEDLVYVYFSRTKHNFLVVYNFQDYWDMAQFGFFEPFQSIHEYPFPALVMSSNIGVRPRATLEYVNGNPQDYHYFLYDYTHDNISLGHSMPCNISTWWDGNKSFANEYGNSGVQAMDINGNWISMTNYGIRSDSYYNRSWGVYWSSLKEPELLNTGTNHYTTVYKTDVTKTVDPIPQKYTTCEFDWDFNNFDKYISAQNTTEFNLQPLYMVQCDEENINQNMMGVIPATYWCPHRVNRYGLYINDGRLYLVVPNCREGRRWHMNAYYSVMLGNTQSDEFMASEKERLDKLSEPMNTAFDLGVNIGGIQKKEW